MQATDPVAIPYAEALVGLGQDRDALLALRDQVATLLAAFDAEPDALLVLESPRVAVEAKLGVIERSLRGRLDDVLCDFLCVVIKHNRSIHLRNILEEAVRAADVGLGRLGAQLQSAKDVPADELAAIEKALEKLTGHDVIMDVRVRPELIGGTRIRMGDQVVDATVRTRLREMRRRLDAVRLTGDVFEHDGKDAS